MDESIRSSINKSIKGDDKVILQIIIIKVNLYLMCRILSFIQWDKQKSTTNIR